MSLPGERPGQSDHLAGQVHDPHGLAHLQQEEARRASPSPSAEVAGGVQDKLRRLRNGHEEAFDVLVGHGDRTAALDLRAEDRHHGAGRAQHVAEAHGGEARALAALLALDDSNT